MIEAQALTRRFGTQTAVAQLSLHVPDGAILALLGQNGAGKTTTVRMLAGLLTPTEGTARVGGYDIRKEATAVRACVGLVTDAPGLFEQMKVPAYLDFFGNLYGMPAPDRRRRIDELLAFFELTEHRKAKMVGFSKGMKQKVALARALMHNPRVLFLDEPTSGLDPLASRNVRELIVNLKQAHRSIILCTHDLDEAERLADEIIIMRKGHVVARGTAAALRAQMSGETQVHIVFARPFPTATSLLKTVNGLNAATPQSNEEQTQLTYQTMQPSLVNPQVVTTLVGAGAHIVSVTCATSSLEDVYASAMQDGTSEQTDAASPNIERVPSTSGNRTGRGN